MQSKFRLGKFMDARARDLSKSSRPEIPEISLFPGENKVLFINKIVNPHPYAPSSPRYYLQRMNERTNGETAKEKERKTEVRDSISAPLSRRLKLHSNSRLNFSSG